jgi:hypothetical protein
MCVCVCGWIGLEIGNREDKYNTYSYINYNHKAEQNGEK